jgi:hypothetical protein
LEEAVITALVPFFPALAAGFGCPLSAAILSLAAGRGFLNEVPSDQRSPGGSGRKSR